MFEIRRAEPTDVDAAVAALGEAFAQDPLMLYFFRDNPEGVQAGVMEFFSILLRVRIALGMPAYVLQEGDGLCGAVMGYDTSRPAWPAPFAEEWRQLEAAVPGLGPRLAAYDKISEAHLPPEDHYYLGVIGVHPSLQRSGAGRAMLETFFQGSRGDPKSGGVYLETASPGSLQFYQANGFEVRGEGSLDGAHVWCVYKHT